MEQKTDFLARDDGERAGSLGSDLKGRADLLMLHTATDLQLEDHRIDSAW